MSPTQKLPVNSPDKSSGGSDLTRRRSMTTARSVIIADKVADWTIRIGGIGVIIAVFGIMLFLAQVVVPLFTGASSGEPQSTSMGEGGGAPILSVIDEYKTLSTTVDATGQVGVFHIESGTALNVDDFDFGEADLTAFARTISGRDVAFGFADGSLRLGAMTIGGEVFAAENVPSGLTRLGSNDLTDGRSIFTQVAGDQIRRISVETSLEEAQQIAPERVPLVAIDYRFGGTLERPTKSFVTVDANGIARLSRAASRTNMLTGQTTTTLTTSELPGLPPQVEVYKVLMTDKADQVFVIDRDGAVYRYDTRNFNQPQLAESKNLLPQGVSVGAVKFLIGEQSLVVGGSDGSVNVYFRLPVDGAQTKDGFVMTRAHELEKHASGIVAMDVSQRGKMFVTADTQGHVWLRHSTSEQVLLKLLPPSLPQNYTVVSFAPREDGVVALTDNGTAIAWDIDAPHPETTLGTIFGKVWYEGYPEPEYTWQSSSGTDAFEPKFSLVPLIFGTVKATVYSLLFAIPIALGAAIYTSEFVHHKVRAVVKPTMELMASLPSVVLGFIAALILAPIVETWIAAVILAFVVIPAGLFFSAYLWQLLPGPVALRYGGVPKFLLMFVSVFVFGYIAYASGSLFERLFFAGDLKAWSNGDIGSSAPVTMLIVFPFVFLAVFITSDRFVTTILGTFLRGQDRVRAGLADMCRWFVTLLVSAGLSYLLAMLLIVGGLDPRGGVVDTYVQRNTLIVGFAMGFAVIPIIYTIAEDALNAVPEHLRAASLGCGATTWQTSINVILPTAMSGVFSAIMVGMGRAVGETMIVVMAAGNTPLLDWNIFNGLRALSANIAVELPEAVRDSTLYRMLFLAALTLFIVTFAVNTLAEVVRQRFRKRAAQL